MPNHLFAAEAERDRVQSLFDKLPKDSYDDLVGVGDLQTSFLSRCDFFVGNDSGNTHVRGVGVPTSLIWPKTEQSIMRHEAESYVARNHMKKSSGPRYDHPPQG